MRREIANYSVIHGERFAVCTTRESALSITNTTHVGKDVSVVQGECEVFIENDHLPSIVIRVAFATSLRVSGGPSFKINQKRTQD